jgi:hypothetical protein
MAFSATWLLLQIPLKNYKWKSFLNNKWNCSIEFSLFFFFFGSRLHVLGERENFHFIRISDIASFSGRQWQMDIVEFIRDFSGKLNIGKAF